MSKYLFHTDNSFEGKNLHKEHYTNNSNKNHHKHCMYTQNYYKKSFTFL